MQNSWQRFAKDRPGQRFQNRYRRRQRGGKRHVVVKALYIILGTVVAVGSLVLAPLPGPGWGTVFVGLMILAGEFRPAAVFLDWLEVRLRKLWDFVTRVWGSGPAGKVAVVAVALLIVAATFYVVYWLLFA